MAGPAPPPARPPQTSPSLLHAEAVPLPFKLPPRVAANTALPAISNNESTATTIALAVATPVGAQPKAPRRTAPNAHAIAEKSEAPTTDDTFAPNGHAIAEKSEAPTTAETFASLHVHT